MPKQRSNEVDGEDPANDEVAEFRRAVRDVKPLPHASLPAAAAKRKPGGRQRKPTGSQASLDVDMPLIDPLLSFDGSGDGHGGAMVLTAAEPTAFQRAGVQTQVVRRLRRGLFPIEDELDLHGLTQAVARDELARFLALNRGAGRRCVRIIHGKGYRSGARGPILKIAVDLWLRRHLDVMAFTSARPIDGGTGALYVLLRA